MSVFIRKKSLKLQSYLLEELTNRAVSPGGKNNINNIIDGNINTAWYSKESTLGGALPAAYVTLKLDEPKYVSELDYIPYANATSSVGNSTGRARSLKVEVSSDNVHWEEVVPVTNLSYNSNLMAKITFDEPALAQYIRITCPAVYESGLKNFFTVAVLNLYENPTVSEIPLAEVSYDIAKKTNKDVVAELVNENREITVTNNGGKKTHTFTENGEFTFEFVDKNGKKGSAIAKVDWIDKIPPKLDVEFSTTDITNEEVVATLSFDKENVTIISNTQLSEDPEDGSKTLTFSKNDSIELKFQDELGNIGTQTITVDWIDLEAPTAEFEFSTTNITDEEVVATLKPSEEVTVLNNDGKDSYTFTKNGSFTFEFVDKAGNAGEATVNVNWIVPLPKYNIKYSTKKLTKEDVKIELELEENYQILNNNASNEYIFTKNGTFEFQYKDKNGNIGVIPVTVDWIDKEKPTAELQYSTKQWTNKNVKVTLKFSEEVTILNNGGKNTYTFTSNGDFTFQLKDLVGNTNEVTAKVDWIDKEAPTAKIKYERKEDKVIVQVIEPSEPIIFKEGYGIYEFTKNGSYDIFFYDKAKNIGKVTAVITGIKEESTTNNSNASGKNIENTAASKKTTNIFYETNKEAKKETTNIEEKEETKEKIEETVEKEEKKDAKKKSEKMNKEEKIGEKKETTNQKYIIPGAVATISIIGAITFILKKSRI